MELLCCSWEAAEVAKVDFAWDYTARSRSGKENFSFLDSSTIPFDIPCNSSQWGVEQIKSLL